MQGSHVGSLIIYAFENVNFSLNEILVELAKQVGGVKNVREVLTPIGQLISFVSQIAGQVLFRL